MIFTATIRLRAPWWGGRLTHRRVPWALAGLDGTVERGVTWLPRTWWRRLSGARL